MKWPAVGWMEPAKNVDSSKYNKADRPKHVSMTASKARTTTQFSNIHRSTGTKSGFTIMGLKAYPKIWQNMKTNFRRV